MTETEEHRVQVKPIIARVVWWRTCDLPKIALLTTLTAALIGGMNIPAVSARVKCRDFSTQQEAQAYMQQYGATYLDGDNDGIACESLPRTNSPSPLPSSATPTVRPSTGNTNPVTRVAGTVVSTGDGDTFRVQVSGATKTVRLAFVDAPEMAQVPYGPAAAQRLKQLLPRGQTVSLRQVDTDRYGRMVAVVHVGNTAVNLQLVREGYAVVYYQYLQNCQDLCTPLQQAEAQAKSARLNFWNQPNPVMPWDYRRSQRR